MLISFSRMFGVIGTALVAIVSARDFCQVEDFDAYSHLHALPKMSTDRYATALDNYYDFCGTKESCCWDETMLASRAAFVGIDQALEVFEFVFEQYLANPMDALILEEHSLSLYEPHSSLSRAAVEALQNLFAAEQGAQFVEAFKSLFTFARSVEGYFSSLSCAACDQNFGDYFTSSGELLIKQESCAAITSGFLKFIDNLSSALQSKQMNQAVVGVLLADCESDGRSSCNKNHFQSDYDTFIKTFVSDNKLGQMLCGGDGKNLAKNCQEMICEKTLRGLAIDLTAMNSTIFSFLEPKCKSNPIKLFPCSNIVSILKNNKLDWINDKGTKGLAKNKILGSKDAAYKTAFDVVGSAKKISMSRNGFSESPFGFKVPQKRHHHWSFFGFLWSLIKFCVIGSIILFVVKFAKDKYDERNGLDIATTDGFYSELGAGARV